MKPEYEDRNVKCNQCTWTGIEHQCDYPGVCPDCSDEVILTDDNNNDNGGQNEHE